MAILGALQLPFATAIRAGAMPMNREEHSVDLISDRCDGAKNLAASEATEVRTRPGAAPKSVNFSPDSCLNLRQTCAIKIEQ